MKKIIIIWMGLILMGFSVIAQENTGNTENTDLKTKHKKEKKERCLLPEQGNGAIGVDMLPLLRSLGTVFWGSNGTMGFQGTPYPFFNGIQNPNVSIMGKYMAASNCAIRANIGVMVASTTRGENIRDDAEFLLNPATEATVTDYTKMSAYGVNIALGAEYRIGKKRVVGIFGGDLLFGYYAGSLKYTYGNIMNEYNQAPTVYNYGTYYATSTSYNTRLLYAKNAGAIAAGVQATAGIEVFVAPKIALGGQVNLSYVFIHNRETHKEGEGFNDLSGKVEKRTDILKPAGWSHKFDTNNVGGALYMIFYF